MLPGDMHLTQLIEGDRLVDFLQVICWTVVFSSTNSVSEDRCYHHSNVLLSNGK
jgi:hypothetical protein